MRFQMGVYTLFWMLSVPAAIAADADASLTLGQATALVLENNPQLQAADFDARAAAERIRQEGQSTPYVLGLEAEDFGGSGRASGADSLQATLSLGRVLELGGKAGQRSRVARLQAGLLRHDQDARRLDLLAETARRFLAAARVQAQRELADQRVDLMQRTLRSVEQRYRVGKAPAAERNGARIALAQAELLLEETHHLFDNGRRQLSVLWGKFEPDFETVRADLFSLEPVPAYATLEQALESNPAIERLATAERLAEARVALAQSRARPDLGLRAGVQHFNASDDVGLMLSLQIPLGSSGRARPYVQEAEVLAQREPLLAQDRRLALRATLSGLRQELVHASHRFETYRSRIVPAAEKMQADTSAGYRAGRYSLLELTSAQDTLLEARSGVLSAAVEYHAARIEIERLIGATPFDGVSR